MEECDSWDRAEAKKAAQVKAEQDKKDAYQKLLTELTSLFGSDKISVSSAEFCETRGMFQIRIEPITEAEVRQWADALQVWAGKKTMPAEKR